MLPSATSFLQPPNVGTFFVVQQEIGGSNNEFQWFLDRHYNAINLLRVLQYSKDGVVHIDYTVPSFRPKWVNELRRGSGLFYFGAPRRPAYLDGKRFFSVTETDLSRLRRRMDVFTSDAMVRLMADESPAFRQASLRAGDYFEASLTYAKPLERLIALAIALEALFSPGDSGELSFRIAQTASQLIGKTAAARRQIYADLRKLYSRRSKVMHGTYNVQQVYSGT